MKNVEQVGLALLTGRAYPLIDGAVKLVNKYNKQGLMLPASFGQYQRLADAGRLAVAINRANSETIGTIAYTQEYPKQILELGGLAVDEEWQKMGIGFALIKFLTITEKHWKTITFANKNSLPLFEKFGAQKFETAEDFDAIPKEAFGLCNACPNKPEVGCCDTVLSLAPGIVAMFESQSAQFDGWQKALSEW